jgi:hypothetical protein
LQTTPVITKTYYIYVGKGGDEKTEFKRYVYTTTQSNLVLIHYKGDDSVAVDTEPHIRTFPSVLRDLEKSKVIPSVAYKRKVSTTAISQEHHSVQLPRNKKQVKNLQSRHRQRLRISHDALYNLHELAYDLENYIHSLTTYPDLIVVCGLKPMLQEINRLLQIESPASHQLLSYDTTFKLGDFYVSPMLFRNVLFEKNPVMPAMFLLHERKLISTHEQLMMVVAKELPCLVNGKLLIPLVTDDEKGFGAIEQHLPNIHRCFCWNHLINAAKLWLKRHGASASEIPVYINNIRDLFHQQSEEQYDVRLNELKLKWSQPFLHYFMNEIHEKVKRNAVGRWNLEKYGIYHPLSGVTSNQSEGFNSVLKRFQGWREVPVDTGILTLYYLQVYYWNEWQRGLAGKFNVLFIESYSCIYVVMYVYNK